MARETWVQSQVESYQRLKKWYVIPPNTQHYKIRFKDKVEQSREKSSALTYTSAWELMKRAPLGRLRLRSPIYIDFYKFQSILRGSCLDSTCFPCLNGLFPDVLDTLLKCNIHRVRIMFCHFPLG